jgi:hypothetical protein
MIFGGQTDNALQALRARETITLELLIGEETNAQRLALDEVEQL